MLRAWFGPTFEAFSSPAYRVLWISTLLAFVSFMMSNTAQSVVAFELEGTNRAVGIVALGNGLAWFAFGPYGGVIADRVSKRLLLVVAQGAVALTYGAVGVLLVTGSMTVLWLTVSTFAVGVAFAFTSPARRAFVTDVVPVSKLGNGVAMMQVALLLPGTLGPALAGLFLGLAFMGAGGTYLFMAGLLLLTQVTLYWLPSGAPPAAEAGATRASAWMEFRAGLRHVWERPRVRLLILTFFAFSVLGFPFLVLLPGLLENELGREARDLGLLQSTFAVAGLLVSVGVAGLTGSRRAMPVMLVMGTLFGGSLLALAAAPSFVTAVLVMMGVGAGYTGFRILNNALIMMGSAAGFHGRVMALTMLSIGAQGMAALPFGALGDAIGERPTLAVLGSGIVVLMVLASMELVRIERREVAA